MSIEETPPRNRETISSKLPSLSGDGIVIVCGGNSERMGTEKCLLDYHGLPQYLHLKNLLSPHFSQIYFSIQQKQKNIFKEEKNIIVDSPEFSGHGPISGILSCMKYVNDRSLIFIGCDYPFLILKDILKLKIEKSPGETIAYFFEHYEPLLARYDRKDFESLTNEFKNKNFSLQKFLQKIGAIKIRPEDPERIRSVDLFSDYIRARNLLAK